MSDKYDTIQMSKVISVNDVETGRLEVVRRISNSTLFANVQSPESQALAVKRRDSYQKIDLANRVSSSALHLPVLATPVKASAVEVKESANEAAAGKIRIVMNKCKKI